MKTAERELARRLRREQGLSVNDLARVVGVSKSSISLWVRDIELTPEQHAALRLAGVAGGRASAERALEKRLAAQGRGRTAVRRGLLTHAAGCMLFWAEGSRSRHSVIFTNSDPAMVAFFRRFLSESLGVPDEKVRVTCNLFADHVDRQAQIEAYWLSLLGLPRSALCRSTVNRYSKYTQKKRRNKLPYGTCRLAVHDTKLVNELYGAIQEYAGFDREEWLL
jgi:transcriptional regulator with XRE-family HTH domain